MQSHTKSASKQRLGKMGRQSTLLLQQRLLPTTLGLMMQHPTMRQSAAKMAIRRVTQRLGMTSWSSMPGWLHRLPLLAAHQGMIPQHMAPALRRK
jgi:hypothetical protein